MAAVGANVGYAALGLTYSAEPPLNVSMLALEVVYAPPDAIRERDSMLALLVVYAKMAHTVPKVSDVALLATYSTAVPSQSQTLAWTFTMDGHTFYVYDIGDEGTFLYDLTTKSWCKFQTQGNQGWNFRNGAMWWTDGAPRFVGGDSIYGYVWELDPLAIFDDGFRDIPHAATAGITLRTRVYHSMSELRIAASAGQLDDTDGAAFIQMAYSDDGGQTYSTPMVVILQVGSTPDGQQDIRFASLGSFMAPGRIFQLYDVGGTLRLDGVDAEIDNYDGEPEAGESEQ
jgi:hypothetical protein